MPEQQFEVRPTGVKYICDHCGVGELVYVRFLPEQYNDPNNYVHQCPHCKNEVALKEKFPTVRFLANVGDTHGGNNNSGTSSGG